MRFWRQAAPISFVFIRKNPHLGLFGLLVLFGIVSLLANIPPLAGALFGAGASLLGAWITEMNSRRSSSEDKARREAEARKYLAHELNRVIERVLYIHERASVNYVCTWAKDGVTPSDLQMDFVPYMPVLYPNAQQFRDLSGDDATALIAFYDSLHALEKFVNDWWGRDGQLVENIFNMLLHLASDSLSLAGVCIERFELEKLFPPKYASWDTLSSRINRTKESAEKSREHRTAKFNAQRASSQVHPTKNRRA
ncbi:MAG: hypothetical protein FWD67_00745 [Betaproteobacteria bacterium]|nr:hypothetical protein [Betaproteobacteria bacterium]